jgi:BirA family transcriptional regulator, biotin operon repressor / biotin---[acetyl-CoA-carboxylase] ligase
MFDTDNATVLYQLSQQLQQDSGLTVRMFAKLDSTNSQLLSIAEQLPLYPTAPLAYLALQQTVGRGRLGRTWQTKTELSRTAPQPAFMASIGLCTALSMAHLCVLPLHIGVAVAQYLQGLGLDVGVKWPNDIVLRTTTGTAKLGGILIETRALKDNPEHTAIIIGLGLNWYAAPTIEGRKTACVTDNLPSYARPNATAACAALLSAMHLGWQRTYTGLRCDFAAFDVLAGQPVTLHTPMNPCVPMLTGIAQGVNTQGYLGVRTHQGLQWLHSGEASLSSDIQPVSPA